MFLKEKWKLSCYTDNIKYGDRMLPACGKAMSGSRKSDRKVREKTQKSIIKKLMDMDFSDILCVDGKLWNKMQDCY